MAKHKFEIWQTDDRNRLFTSARVLKAVGMRPVKDKSYKKIYEGEIDSDGTDENVLDEIFSKYQSVKPEGYSGRSVSVSDMITLDGKTFFTDSFGFKRLSKSAAAGSNG